MFKDAGIQKKHLRNADSAIEIYKVLLNPSKSNKKLR